MYRTCDKTRTTYMNEKEREKTTLFYRYII